MLNLKLFAPLRDLSPKKRSPRNKTLNYVYNFSSISSLTMAVFSLFVKIEDVFMIKVVCFFRKMDS